MVSPASSPLPDGDRLPPRYIDVVHVADGSFGRVYRAVSAEHGLVAVKVLDAGLGARPEVQWAFEEEGRRLARFDHPGLPRALDKGRTDAGNPYVAMAWATGEVPGGPMEPVALRALLVGIAEVLSYLHALGYVHGDLKPDNVKMAADGHVAVFDLGLMARIGEPREGIAGTLEYLAPEAFRRVPVAVAADLYALGVLAYALRTGHVPFTGSPGALIEAHLRAPVPSWHAPVPDAELDALILALLAKEPSRRPASGAAVLSRLGVGEGDGESDSGLQRALDPGDYIDCAHLLSTWSAVLAGQQKDAVLWILGGSGLGKSRALDECRLAAVVAGQRWVGAACTGGLEAPAGPLRAVVAQALATAGISPADRVSAWMSGRVPEDVALLEPASRRSALLAAAADALGEAATALGGLVIGLDDWHLADVASQEALGPLRQGVGQAPVTWLLAAEAAVGDETTVTLTPLDPPSQVAWLSSRLGAPAPAGLADDLLGVGSGVPGLLDMLLEDAVASGALESTADGWRYHALKFGKARPSDLLAASWRGRLTSLTPTARELATLLGLGFNLGALGAWELAPVLGLAVEALGAAADELGGIGLVRWQAGALRLASQGLVVLILADVPALQQAEWRTALARQLARPDLLGHPAEEVAFDIALGAARLALAGSDARLALGLAGVVALRCLALVATAAALELADSALALIEGGAASTDPAQVRTLHFIRAEAARMLDRAALAIPSYQHVTAAKADPHHAAAAIGLAKCLQLRGDYPGAAAALALVDLQQTPPDVGARASLTLARLAVFGNALPSALAHVDEAISQARAAGHSVLLAQALTLRGVLGIQHDPAAGLEGVRLIAEAIALGEATGDRLAVAMMYDNLGNAYLGMGALAEAATAFDRFADGMEALGAQTELLSARLNQARVAADRGETAAATTLAGSAVQRAAKAGRRFPEGLALGVLSQAAWRAGDFAAAKQALDAALTIAAQLDNAYMRSYLELFALDLALAQGNLKAAVKAAGAPGQPTGAQGEVARRKEVARAELALLQGDAARALALALPLTDSYDRWLAYRAQSVRAEAALLEGDGPQARVAADAALALATAWQSPWHEAAAKLAHAVVARAENQPESADWAREAYQLAHSAGNPYVQLRAAVLLQELGANDSGLLTEAKALLATLLQPLTPLERAAFIARWELGAWGMSYAASGGGFSPTAVSAAFDEIAEATDEGAITSAVLRGAMSLTHAERGFLLAYQDGRLGRVVAHGLDYAREVESGFSHSIAEQALFSAEPIYLRDAGADAQWQNAASVMALGLRTVVALPLSTPDEIFGVLYMDRSDPEPLLSEADMGTLLSLARAASRALASEAALTLARTGASRQAACAKLGARLLGVPAAERLAQTLAALCECAGAERAIRLLRQGSEWLAPDLPQQAPPSDLSFGIADWVVLQSRPLALFDVGAHEDWAERGSVQALGVRTIWCLPLGQAGGVVYLDAATAEGDVGPAVVATLQALVSYAGAWLAHE